MTPIKEYIMFFQQLYLLLFSVGLSYAFMKVLGGYSNIRKRFSSFERLFTDRLKWIYRLLNYRLLKNEGEKSKKKSDFTFSSSLWLIVILIIIVLFVIVMFNCFYLKFGEVYINYGPDLLNSIVFSVYGLAVILIPVFIPGALNSFLSGFFPCDVYHTKYTVLKDKPYKFGELKKDSDIMNYLNKDRKYYEGVRNSRFNFFVNIAYVIILSFFLLSCLSLYIYLVIFFSCVVSAGIILLKIKASYVDNFSKKINKNVGFYESIKNKKSRANKNWDELAEKFREII